MLGSLYDMVFGCTHRRTTFPLTPTKKSGLPQSQTYVVCLECGKQLAYDWKEMRIGEPLGVPAEAPNSGRPQKAQKKKSKLRYAGWAAALPVAWLIGSAVQKSRKNSGEPPKAQ
jgi:hypothetical protein